VQVRAIINEAFYKNLFLSVSSDQRNERGTAYEWSLRKQEEFAVLGPVVENFSFDVLDPFVDISFALMIQQKRVPPPPRELQGRMLGVRYVSSMAQAQKATGLRRHRALPRDRRRDRQDDRRRQPHHVQGQPRQHARRGWRHDGRSGQDDPR
jgi:hypothetical protein